MLHLIVGLERAQEIQEEAWLSPAIYIEDLVVIYAYYPLTGVKERYEARIKKISLSTHKRPRGIK